MALEILIVDDERDIRELVAGVLSDEGYECRTAGGSEAALEAVDARRPSLVLLDVWLHGSPMDGLEVLDAIKSREPELPVIIFSGHGNIDTAVAAISRGAVDFIEKPFEAEKLLHLVGRATETERLRRENAQLKQDYSVGEEFTGSSAAINHVRATLKRIANTGSRLLITGPAGSGKEVAARLLHAWSPRAENAFVSVNSARITPERFEQELFGEEADGALVRPGLLEMADGGTLYFDEVADMPLSTQARILRVLTDQAFVRVGGTRQIRVDVRVVSSTSRDLEKEIAERRFREDLFYRLSVFPLAWPALRHRPADIVPLAERLLTNHAAKMRQPVARLTSEARLCLLGHTWPGNVRELDNAIQRALILQQGGMIRPDDLCLTAAAGFASLARTHTSETELTPSVAPVPAEITGALGEDLRRREFELILDTLRAERGRRKETADRLGISARTLRYKLAQMRDAGMDPEAALRSG